MHSESVASRKIFIGGLSYSTDDEKLRKYFSSYGVVQDAVVMKDTVTRRSRGFGFISYLDPDSLDRALQVSHTIDGRKVEAKRAVPRADGSTGPKLVNPPSHSKTSSDGSATNSNSSSNGISNSNSNSNINSNSSSSQSGSSTSSVGSDTTSPKPVAGLGAPTSYASMMHDSTQSRDPHINMDEYAYNKIFVGGLHYNTRDPEFKAYFSKYGKIISAEVMISRETHKSRGFGFVVFEQERFAEAVCREKEHFLDCKMIEIKRAIPRSKILNGSSDKPTSSASAPNTSSASTIAVHASVSLSSSSSGASQSLSSSSQPIAPQSSSSNVPGAALAVSTVLAAAKHSQMGPYDINSATHSHAQVRTAFSYAAAVSSPSNPPHRNNSNFPGGPSSPTATPMTTAMTTTPLSAKLQSLGSTMVGGATPRHSLGSTVSGQSDYTYTSAESEISLGSNLDEPALSVGGGGGLGGLGSGMLGLDCLNDNDGGAAHIGLWNRPARSNSLRSERSNSFSSTVGTRSESGYDTGLSSMSSAGWGEQSSTPSLSLPSSGVASPLNGIASIGSTSIAGFGFGNALMSGLPLQGQGLQHAQQQQQQLQHQQQHQQQQQQQQQQQMQIQQQMQMQLQHQQQMHFHQQLQYQQQQHQQQMHFHHHQMQMQQQQQPQLKPQSQSQSQPNCWAQQQPEQTWSAVCSGLIRVSSSCDADNQGGNSYGLQQGVQHLSSFGSSRGSCSPWELTYPSSATPPVTPNWAL